MTADNNSSIMIALLPIVSDWCKLDLPHLTLVYAGQIADQKPGAFNEMAKDASMLATLASPITLRTNGLDVFGGRNPDDPLGASDPMMDVIKLFPTPELMAMRRMVESWDASNFPFNPHVSIGPQGGGVPFPVPSCIAFNRVACCWGNDQLTFNMSSSSPY